MKWPSVKLDSIKANSRYSFVGGPFGSNLTTRDYVEEGIPVIRGNNLPADATFHDDDFVFVSEEKAGKLFPNLAYPGDVIFTQRGTLGQIGIIPNNSRFTRYVLSQSQMKISIDVKVAEAAFIYYFFRSPNAVSSITNHASSSGVPHINLGILKKFEVPLPPLDVQRQIVNILSGYDRLIENNRRRMALIEDIARNLYREWFLCLQFPGHEHTKIVNGVPNGWQRKQLSEIAKVNATSLPSSFDSEIEYVDIASVSPGIINETTTYNFCEAPSRARRVVKHGDIIWSCVRPNRRSYAIVWHPPTNLIASTGFAVLTPLNVPSLFLYSATTTDAFVGYLENHARGAAYPAVVAKDFERAELLIPKASLLELFDEITTPIFNQLHILRQQNSKLNIARDLLLPRLMSGEISL